MRKEGLLKWGLKGFRGAHMVTILSSWSAEEKGGIRGGWKNNFSGGIRRFEEGKEKRLTKQKREKKTA